MTPAAQTRERGLRPQALDLFCGAGGASMGLHRAGFDVTGIDYRKQPRYPFRFIQADALNPPLDLSRFDLIWASPPCQAHTSLKTMWNAKAHIDLIPQTRELLARSGVPYVIENVPGSNTLRPLIQLCGTAFGLGCEGAELRRHRHFETSFIVLAPPCRHGSSDTIGIYGGHQRNRRRVATTIDRGVADFTVNDGRKAMQIDWMTLAELCQSIPPAYSEYIGHWAMRSLAGERAA